MSTTARWATSRRTPSRTDSLETGVLRSHYIIAGNQKGDLVVSIVAGRSGGHLAGIRILHVDLGSRNRRTRRVGDPAGQRSPESWGYAPRHSARPKRTDRIVDLPEMG